MSSNEAVQDFLEHFGVKGMRWGVRKEGEHSARYNRAKKSDARAADYQKQINELNSTKSSYYKTVRIKELEQARDNELAISNARREGKLTPNQKKAAIGAGVVVALAATYATYKVADSGEFNRLVIKGREHFSGTPHSWKKDPRLVDKDIDISTLKSRVVDKINPHYGMPGTKMNCRRATFAYEMRRRGNDVRATKSVTGTGQTIGGVLKATTKEDIKIPTTTVGLNRRLRAEAYNSTTKPGKIRATDLLLKRGFGRSAWGKEVISISGLNNHDSIFNALRSQPDGARGELAFGWKAGGGHSVAWEIIKGKPHIIDAQSKTIYKDPMEFLKVSKNIKEAAFTRLDNVDLNDNYLLRWLSDA